jgi:hypothetical protein
MGLGSCLTEPGCWVAESQFLPLVGLLSFPSGPLLLILNNIFADVVFTIDLSADTLYSVESGHDSYRLPSVVPRRSHPIRQAGDYGPVSKSANRD